MVQVDIFSLGIMMYEMLYGYTVLCMICHCGAPQELQDHANRYVAEPNPEALIQRILMGFVCCCC